MDSSVKDYKYYSFMVGPKGSKKQTWQRSDLKIPAIDIRSALTMYFILKSYVVYDKARWRKKKMYGIPSQGLIFNSVRQVIEYKKVWLPAKYYTEHRYKQIRIYNVHEILKYFPN